MQSLACTVTTDHLRFHFVVTTPGETTRDMGSANKAKHCQNTTNEVARASKFGSHKRQGSQFV
eukprot:2743581-Amphidinium_carterae.1